MRTDLPTGTNRPRARRRRSRAAVAAAAVALVPLLSACEVTTDVDFTCSIIGVLNTQIRSNATPDSVPPGQAVTNEIDVALPAITTDVPVNMITVDYPLPTQLDPGSVTAVFTGGNVTGSYAVVGTQLRITFVAGGISSTVVDLPVITVAGTVALDAFGGTMAWPAPQQIQLAVDFLGTPITETCNVAAGTPEINNTNIDGPPDPTPTTTTTRVVTTTTSTVPEPTTTTVPEPTTTTTRVPWDPNAPEPDTQTDYVCSIIGMLKLVTGTAHVPEPVAPGGTVKITTASQVESITTDVPVEELRLYYPVPRFLSVTDVETAGAMETSWAIEGDVLVVRLDQERASSTNLEIPTITITADVAADAEGVITVLVASQFQLAIDFLGTPLTETCTAQAGAPALELITVR